MSKYLIRLDDASEYMDLEKWNLIEKILDMYNIKPIVGIIPNNKDPELLSKYEKNEDFWNKVTKWEDKGWIIAMHGYEHVFCTEEGGINPVNYRSEFAGIPLEEQCVKIHEGYQILKSHGLKPEIFFAPAHTFDENTMEALRKETEIRIINDTVANDVYYKKDFFFIPQQSGHVRRLPFRMVTFCYHPNNMSKACFEELAYFIEQNREKFINYDRRILNKRKFEILDSILNFLYFIRR